MCEGFLTSQVYDSGRGGTLFGPTWIGDSIFGITSNPVNWPKRDYFRGMLGFQFVRAGLSPLCSRLTVCVCVCVLLLMCVCVSHPPQYDVFSRVIMTNTTFRNYKQDPRWPLATNVDYSTNCLSSLQNNVQYSINEGAITLPI